MMKANVQPGRASATARAALGTLSMALFCAGCASPGPPKPPSLRLPQPVKDLSAERSGDRVLLRWTTPSRTTDDIDIKGAMIAEICREISPGPTAQAARPSVTAARPAACSPILRLPVAPGPSEAADTLTPSLQADPVRPIAYRIQIFNSAGRSAGDSTAAAYAAAGSAPPDVAQLRAHAAEQGAVLQWDSEWDSAPHSPGTPPSGLTDVIDLIRVDLSSSPLPEKKPKSRSAPPAGKKPGRTKSAKPQQTEVEEPNTVHLRAADSPGSKPDTAGTVDTTAAMGDTYTYVARRVRPVTIGSRALEIQSNPSPTVTLSMRDIFPPKPPTGLETISGNSTPNPAAPGAEAQPYIDLSWEPSAEPDLAGYRVYRQLARPDGSPQGPLARLTPLPIAVPGYRDVAVKPGQGYIYTVTAVDAAGNESAPSAKALEFVSDAAHE